MLALTLVCVGRAKAGIERDLSLRYVDRACAMGRSLGLTLEIRELAESRARRPADRKREEAVTILACLDSKLADAVVFDETGISIDSAAFASMISRAVEAGSRALPLVIGGPDGLDPSIRNAARHVVAFGTMTWPHQLVRIMAAEQLYRAVTIVAGHPYHRG